MDKQLRVIAGTIITESKLSKGAKLQLLNFIQKEATDTQVKALLLDGKVLSKIDEQTEQIIKDRFVSFKLPKLVSEETQYLQEDPVTAFLASAAVMAAFRAIRAASDEKLRKCGVFGVGPKHSLCMKAAKEEENDVVSKSYVAMPKI
jgi:hypothetical protein